MHLPYPAWIVSDNPETGWKMEIHSHFVVGQYSSGNKVSEPYTNAWVLPYTITFSSSPCLCSMFIGQTTCIKPDLSLPGTEAEYISIFWLLLTFWLRFINDSFPIKFLDGGK